jgi:hypothetical protein
LILVLHDHLWFGSYKYDLSYFYHLYRLISSKVSTLTLDLKVHIPSYNLYGISRGILVRKWCIRDPSLGFRRKDSTFDVQ